MIRLLALAFVLLASTGASGCGAQRPAERAGRPAQRGNEAAPTPPWEVEQDGERIVLMSPEGGRSVLVEAPANALHVRRVADDLVEVRISCGSPCSASLYVSTQTGRASEMFSDVLAVDSTRERVAVPTPGGVAVYGLWEGAQPLTDVSLSLSPTAAPVSAFVRAAFLDDGSLRVVHLRGSEFEEATAVVPVPSESR